MSTGPAVGGKVTDQFSPWARVMANACVRRVHGRVGRRAAARRGGFVAFYHDVPRALAEEALRRERSIHRQSLGLLRGHGRLGPESTLILRIQHTASWRERSARLATLCCSGSLGMCANITGAAQV